MLLKKEYELVRSLDILEIIQKYVDINPDWSVDKCELQLNISKDTETFVDVHYYDLSKPITSINVSEEATVKRFKPSVESVDKMYREIHQLVELPKGVVGLHTVLEEAYEPVYFNMRFVSFKSKE